MHEASGMTRLCSISVAALLAILPATVSAGGGDDDSAKPTCAELQKRADQTPLKGGLKKHRESATYPPKILESPEIYRVGVRLAEVVERPGASDCLVRRDWRVDAEYVYPASAIKTTAAIAALEWLNRREQAGTKPEVGLDSVLWYRRPADFDRLEETTWEWKRGGSLGEIIERTLVVSSNTGFNRLYDLVGHEQLNRQMWEAGLESVRVKHRMFSRRTVDEQKWTPRVAVEVPAEQGGEDGGEATVLETIQPARRSELTLPATEAGRMEVGQTHVDFISGEYRAEPMDFRLKNYMSLADLQSMMVAIFRPELSDRVSFDDLGPYRDFLVDMLGKHPEADEPSQQEELIRRFSPMLPGMAQAVDRERLTVYNKAGRAYGFHIDNAYVVDQKTGRQFFVTAVIYANENEKLNDNDYQYETVTYPFLRAVGRMAVEQLL